MNLLLRQVTVCDPGSPLHGRTLDLQVRNGSFSLPEDGPADLPAFDADGHFISPGFVDAFADYGEPGHEHMETIAGGLEKAASGGITRVLVAPNTTPPASDRAGISYMLGRAAGHRVHLHPLGAISKQIEGKELAEMMDMHRFGAVAFTDGWKPVQNALLMSKAMEYVKQFGGLLVQLPADASLSRGGLMHEGIHSTYLGMPGIPSVSETILIARDIDLLRYTGSRLHLTGVSAAGSVALVRAAKAEGLDVSCSVAVSHLAGTDELLHSYDSRFKTMPPLRAAADREALLEGLADGTIDCIVSHHRPTDWDDKSREFEYAGWGMSLQPYLFPLAYEATAGTVPLDRLVDAVSIRPRALFGLPEATIAPGRPAEYSLFRIDDAASGFDPEGMLGRPSEYAFRARPVASQTLLAPL